MICKNTAKSPEDQREFAVTQTPVKDHLLGPVWKANNNDDDNNNNNKQQPESITEAKEATILRDFTNQTDRKIKTIDQI